MKVLIVGDVHWSTYSSILRTTGKHFSTRLEHLIASINWVEDIAKKYECTEEIFLGDFFDKPELSAEELTALSEIDWNRSCRLRHFIVGNHESGVASLVYNSTQALSKVGVIEDQVVQYPLDEATDILFLPYITEDERKPISSYITKKENKKLIICSHNDIKGFQFGSFISKNGFDINDIEANCCLYLNGHLHNCGKLTDKIINVGNLVGQNFSEDAFKYEHHIAVLDTDTLKITFIENPFALNFYKIDIANDDDVDKLSRVKPNAVVAIKCLDIYLEKTKQAIIENSNIIKSKVLCYSTDTIATTTDIKFETVDHLAQFKEFVFNTLGTSDIVKEEVQEICK